jgi:3-methyladenine DNA glycosylase AlkD
MNGILTDIRKKLGEKADEKVRIQGEKYFKENVKLYGVKNPEVHLLSKTVLKNLPDRSRTFVFPLCEALWRSGYIEESIIACNLTEALGKTSQAEDIEVFEKWISLYVNNWASCDTFCNHTVGDLLMKFPELIGRTKKWALSENRWMKRASAVSLIVPARRGLFLADIFEIAGILLTDRDDMVQKGYGWMLKAASEAHQQEVYDYVMKRRKIIPRTAFRYAIEKMPAELRSKAMLKD